MFHLAHRWLGKLEAPFNPDDLVITVSLYRTFFFFPLVVSSFFAATRLWLSPKGRIALLLGFIEKGGTVMCSRWPVEIPFNLYCSVLATDTTMPFWDFPCALVPKPASGHHLDFPCCSHQIRGKEQLKGRRAYFGSSLWVKFSMVEKAWGGSSQCILDQEAEGRQEVEPRCQTLKPSPSDSVGLCLLSLYRLPTGLYPLGTKFKHMSLSGCFTLKPPKKLL